MRDLKFKIGDSFYCIDSIDGYYLGIIKKVIIKIGNSKNITGAYTNELVYWTDFIGYYEGSMFKTEKEAKVAAEKFLNLQIEEEKAKIRDLEKQIEEIE